MTFFMMRLFLLLALGFPQNSAGERPDGARVFQTSCYSCHHPGSGYSCPGAGTTSPDDARLHPAFSRVRQDEGTRCHLTPEERVLWRISWALRIRHPGAAARKLCGQKLLHRRRPQLERMGCGSTNSRFQPGGKAGLGRDDVPRLKLKWAFGFPGASATYGQPTVAGGRLFVGSEDGTVYSLDARTGCTYWTYKAEATVKTAVSIDSAGHTAFFGDTNGNVYAVLVRKRPLLWKVHADLHPAARITGSPSLIWRAALRSCLFG